METSCLIPPDALKAQLTQLPRAPGVYLMRDAQGRVIYVGKAGVLRNRVRSYFGDPSNLAPKVRAMVARVADFDYIVTGSEKEALLLESNLLKEHRPRYNIKLRDDKQYLYLKISTPSRYPRVYTARQVSRDGARYFGPYTNSQALRQTIKHLQRLFQFRTCALDMEKEYRRPCLLYHIKRCSGPCIRAVERAGYRRGIDELIAFLEGRHDEVIDALRKEMAAAAESLAFERAASLRDRIASAERVSEQQRITSVGRGDLDAIAFAQEEGEVAVQVFTVRGDKIVGREAFALQDADGATAEEIVSEFVQQYYERATYVPPTVLIPARVESSEVIEAWLTDRRGSRVKLEMPQRGAKRQLLDLVKQNATEALERMRQRWLADDLKTRSASRELGDYLKMDEAPRRIECYDISHIQGTSTVASMVVFEDGRPARQAYRRFRIKAGDQNDDFASMHEVIGRRFKRAVTAQAAGVTPSSANLDDDLDEAIDPGDMALGTDQANAAGAVVVAASASASDTGFDGETEADELAARAEVVAGARRAEQTGEAPSNAGDAGLLAPEDSSDQGSGPNQDKGGWGAVPDLVIIDGGKGQLGAAMDALQEIGVSGFKVVGLAKDHEEIFRPGYSEALLLPRTSQALYLVQRIRDEAHRFAVTYHQQVRNKRMVGSRLDTVSGIGPKRKKELIRRFGSVEGIRKASDDELLTIPGITGDILSRLREQL